MHTDCQCQYVRHQLQAKLWRQRAVAAVRPRSLIHQRTNCRGFALQQRLASTTHQRCGTPRVSSGPGNARFSVALPLQAQRYHHEGVSTKNCDEVRRTAVWRRKKTMHWWKQATVETPPDPPPMLLRVRSEPTLAQRTHANSEQTCAKAGNEMGVEHINVNP